MFNYKKARRYVYNPEKHDKPNLVSISQIQQYMKCPKAWNFSYTDKIVKRVEKKYLSIGKICHAAMAASWEERFRQQNTGESDYPKILNSGLEALDNEYNKYLEEADPEYLDYEELDIIHNDSIEIFKMALKIINPERYLVLGMDMITPMVEFHFRVPCGRTQGMHGYIDAVLQEIDSGDIWAVDWKFRSQMTSEAEEPFNLQNAVYHYALDKMGVPITGSLTWQFLNKAPATPNMNKNNTMSRAKIRTTWEVYAEHLILNGLNPEDYELEMREKLEDMPWDRPIYEYRNLNTLGETWKQIIEPAANIVVSKRKKIVAAMYPWNCRMCDYSPICLAEIRGYDVDYIKEVAYMPKPSYNEPVKNILDDDSTSMV